MSKLQREILSLLANGWQLGMSDGYGRAWAQKGKVGHGGESKRVNASTFQSLMKREWIALTERKFPTSRYDITEAGREALAEKLP